MLYKPRHWISIEIPKNTVDRTTETVIIEPLIIESTWTRNNHLDPDELKITIDGRDGGLDIRTLRNARCVFSLWDEASHPRSEPLPIRFTGILTKPERALDEHGGYKVTLTFKDWTTLFVEKRDYAASGVPEWTDTLRTAWAKICDHTGYWDPTNLDPKTGTPKIASSVEALRNQLVFADPSLESVTIGAMVPERFRAISRPTPPKNAPAWVVWQWIVTSLGLVSYIDRDVVHVKRVTDHYAPGSEPAFIFGHNVLSLTESGDSKIPSKGILLRSFDPLRGALLESAYPPAGDPRVKHPRVKAKLAAAGRATVNTAPDAFNDYVPYNFPHVSDQAALDAAAQAAWEQQRRQELAGKLTTREMITTDEHGNRVSDILDLEPGDSIRVDMDPETRAHYRSLGDESQRVAYLIDRGYRPDVARVISMNASESEAFEPVYHVEAMQVRLTPDGFDAEIAYHNKIQIMQGTRQ